MTGIRRSVRSPWKISQGAIAAGDTVVVDVAPNTTLSMNYIISAEGNDMIRQQHYSLIFEDGALKSNVFSRLGALKISVSEALVGGDIQVSLTNNEAFDIVYDLAVLKQLK